MKKRLVTLLAGLLTVLSMGFGLAQFSDVPAGHWAKEAVEALAAKGIILGSPATRRPSSSTGSCSRLRRS